MKSRIWIGLIAAIALPVFAQDGGNAVNFSAQKMVIDQNAMLTELIGSAQLTRGKLSMNAEHIYVYSVKSGESGQKFDHLEAKGGVNAKTGNQTITSSNMSYDANTEIAVFSGDVVVKQGSNVARAQKAVLNIQTGIYTLSGPVKGVITGTLP